MRLTACLSVVPVIAFVVSWCFVTHIRQSIDLAVFCGGILALGTSLVAYVKYRKETFTIATGAILWFIVEDLIDTGCTLVFSAHSLIRATDDIHPYAAQGMRTMMFFLSIHATAQFAAVAKLERERKRVACEIERVLHGKHGAQGAPNETDGGT